MINGCDDTSSAPVGCVHKRHETPDEGGLQACSAMSELDGVEGYTSVADFDGAELLAAGLDGGGFQTQLEISAENRPLDLK